MTTRMTCSELTIYGFFRRTMDHIHETFNAHGPYRQNFFLNVRLHIWPMDRIHKAVFGYDIRYFIRGSMDRIHEIFKVYGPYSQNMQQVQRYIYDLWTVFTKRDTFIHLFHSGSQAANISVSDVTGRFPVKDLQPVQLRLMCRIVNRVQGQMYCDCFKLYIPLTWLLSPLRAIDRTNQVTALKGVINIITIIIVRVRIPK